MTNSIFIIFLILHVLGDFTFQREKLSSKKDKDFFKLIIHCLGYFLITSIFIAVLFIAFPKCPIEFILYALLFVVAHLIIDFGKWLVIKNTKRDISDDNSKVYIIDQALHFLTIILICFLVIDKNNIIILSDLFKSIDFKYSINTILRLVLLLLVIFKPTNITFKKIFYVMKPTEKKETDIFNKKSINNMGAIIGNMERLLIVIFLIFNQYAAIGLVFTAKSIARYNKISLVPEFAEYYLLGTLFSILSVIISFVLIWLI